jgi:hypothetical protein
MTTSDYIALVFIFIILGVWGYRMSRHIWSCPDCYDGKILHAERYEHIKCPTCNGTGRKSKISWL